MRRAGRPLQRARCRRPALVPQLGVSHRDKARRILVPAGRKPLEQWLYFRLVEEMGRGGTGVNEDQQGRESTGGQPPRRAGFLPGALWTMITYTLILITVNIVFFWPPAVAERDFQGDVPGVREGLVDEGDGYDTAGQLARIRQLVPAADRERPNPLEPSAEVIRQGRSLYANSCSVCHGPEGNADVPMARALNPPPVNFTHPAFADMEPGATFWVISNGIPGSGMPPFGSVYTEEEIWALVHFLRETFVAKPAQASPSEGKGEGVPSYRGMILDPPRPAPDFTLRDHRGAVFRLRDYRGDVVVLFFGYTHCPDVCPLTLSYYADVQQRLGPLADRVHFVFVTVDPQRDTPQRLEEYLSRFSPRFTGLWGTPAQVESVLRRYAIYREVAASSPGPARTSADRRTGRHGAGHGGAGHGENPNPSGEILETSSEILHTSWGLVIDTEGYLRLAHGAGIDPEEMAADLRRLLAPAASRL